jgi:hypothetical protein
MHFYDSAQAGLVLVGGKLVLSGITQFGVFSFSPLVCVSQQRRSRLQFQFQL